MNRGAWSSRCCSSENRAARAGGCARPSEMIRAASASYSRSACLECGYLGSLAAARGLSANAAYAIGRRRVSGSSYTECSSRMPSAWIGAARPWIREAYRQEEGRAHSAELHGSSESGLEAPGCRNARHAVQLCHECCQPQQSLDTRARARSGIPDPRPDGTPDTPCGQASRRQDSRPRRSTLGLLSAPSPSSCAFAGLAFATSGTSIFISRASSWAARSSASECCNLSSERHTKELFEAFAHDLCRCLGRSHGCCDRPRRGWKGRARQRARAADPRRARRIFAPRRESRLRRFQGCAALPPSHCPHSGCGPHGLVGSRRDDPPTALAQQGSPRHDLLLRLVAAARVGGANGRFGRRVPERAELAIRESLSASVRQLFRRPEKEAQLALSLANGRTLRRVTDEFARASTPPALTSGRPTPRLALIGRRRSGALTCGASSRSADVSTTPGRNRHACRSRLSCLARVAGRGAAPAASRARGRRIARHTRGQSSAAGCEGNGARSARAHRPGSRRRRACAPVSPECGHGSAARGVLPWRGLRDRRSRDP